MAGTMPLMMPAPSMSAGGDLFRSMGAQERAEIAARAAAKAAQQDRMVDLSKSIIAQTGNMAKVYGGMQTAGTLERMLGNADVYGSSVTPLTAGMLSGAYTQNADSRRAAQESASIAATGRSGRGSAAGDGKRPSAFVRLADGRLIGVAKPEEALQLTTGQGGQLEFPAPGTPYERYDNGNWYSEVVGGGDGSAVPPPVDSGDGGDPAPASAPTTLLPEDTSGITNEAIPPADAALIEQYASQGIQVTPNGDGTYTAVLPNGTVVPDVSGSGVDIGS